MTTKAIERDEYRDKLLDTLQPGDTLYTVLRHKSASSMSRAIDVLKIEDGTPHRLTYWIAKAVGIPYSERYEALRVDGAGMDMGFHVVMNLGYALWPDGFTCTGHACPSNDHSNGDRDYTPHHHKSGGYALRQRWI